MQTHTSELTCTVTHTVTHGEIVMLMTVNIVMGRGRAQSAGGMVKFGPESNLSDFTFDYLTNVANTGCVPGQLL